MAIVKAKAGKGSLSDVFNYVLDKEKTDDTLISSKDCMAETAQKEFELTKHRFGKTDGRTYFHIVQSFSPEDDITPYEANNIGLEFAEFFEGYQVLVVTHTNREHLHNHIIVNSVSFEDGKKLHMEKADLQACQVLVVDGIGFLSSIYRYGIIAYIGGGFGKGIHNTLEAAVYGIPVIFGPRHEKFKEALDLLKQGGGFTINNTDEFTSLVDSLIENPAITKTAGQNALSFVQSQLGATDAIIRQLVD